MSRRDTLDEQIRATLGEVASETRADTELVERLIVNARAGRRRIVTLGARRIWIAPLLAAAAVVIVAVSTSAIVSSPASKRPTPATHSSPPAPRPDRSPSPVGLFRSLSCTVGYPDSWTSATSGIIRPPNAPAAAQSLGLLILGVSPAGAVIASSDVLPHGELVLVEPDGSTRALFQVPASLSGQSPVRVSSASIDDRWVVFSLSLGGGQGAIGGIDAVDLTDGSVHVIRDTSLGTELIVSPPVLLNGYAYWSEITNSGQGHVYGSDLATGTKSTLDSGRIIDPQLVGGAVEWGHDRRIVWHGSPHLPAGFSVQPGKVATLLQDGSTYAWPAWQGSGTVQRQVILMGKTGMQTPETIYTPPSPELVVSVLALSGPYLIWDDGTSLTALDTRTGAATTLTNSQPPFTNAAAAGGIIAENVIGSKGGAQLVLIHTAALTELHC